MVEPLCGLNVCAYAMQCIASNRQECNRDTVFPPFSDCPEPLCQVSKWCISPALCASPRALRKRMEQLPTVPVQKAEQSLTEAEADFLAGILLIDGAFVTKIPAGMWKQIDKLIQEIKVLRGRKP